MGAVIEKLEKEGLRLKSYATGNHKTVCPKCSHTRRNKTDPCLSITIEADRAAWYCHHCEFAGGVSNERTESPVARTAQPQTYKLPPPPPDVLHPTALQWLMEERKISEKVIRANKLCSNGAWIQFPCFYKGQVVNIKSRTRDKKFKLEAGAELIFYGLDWLKDNDTLIITEGELDMLAIQTAGITQVISVPNGAVAKVKDDPDASEDGKRFGYLRHAEDIIKKYKKVILAVDNDQPGRNLEYELARRIGVEKCYRVRFGEGIKDANQALIELGADHVLDAIKDAEPLPVHGYLHVEDFQQGVMHYFLHGARPGESTGWENVDRFYTARPGEITVVTGVPNMGKSEFIDALFVNMAKNSGWKFAVFSPENQKEQHVLKLCEKVSGSPTAIGIKERITQDALLQAMSFVNDHFSFIVSENNSEDAPTLEWILDRARTAVFRDGIRGLLIDPYNEIEHTRQRGENETDYINRILAQIKRFAKSNGLHIWIVAHPAKLASVNGKTAPPTLYDISGSANWANKTDMGLVIHRDDKKAQETLVMVKKARFKEAGRQGVAKLIYNRTNGTYAVPVDEADTTTYQPTKVQPNFLDVDD